jgi:hypothetical protein
MQRTRHFGPATIVQGDREAKVECEYEVIQSDGPRTWHGMFKGASAVDEPEPGEAKLRSAEGKVSQIIVDQVFSGTGEGRFQGNGSPPG